MRTLKIKYINSMIAFCKWAESFAPDREEENWLTAQKNYFLREKQKLEAK